MRQSRSRTICKLVLPVVVLVLLGARTSEKSDPAIPDISKRVNAFTIDLLKHCTGVNNHPANTVLSPQSIFHGLAMSYIASGGDTRKELAEAFYFPEKNEELLKDFAELRQQFRKTDKHKRIDVTIANLAWLEKRRDEYKKG